MFDPSEMTRERWQRIQSLFDAAFDIEESQRLSWVAEQCGEDVALRDAVVALLATSEDGDTSFERDVNRAIAGAAADLDSLPTGRTIGRYRIVRLLGRGGMGAVYLAERADREFEQQVALKLIGRAVPGSAITRRFRAERQILAPLNHPNIGRLIDGGASEDGVPYLAMEYVEGTRIDVYCEEHRLGVRERLKLFQHVCAAVQYAHQSLVIHRDIKPSNILVTADGTPKLLDFGIAKLLDPHASVATDDGLTRMHERVLTPEHASPEQVRGDRVGTASDVYSLGVLLYSLLTGMRPYVMVGGSIEEQERVICTVQPAKPSVAVARNAQLSHATQRALKRSLAGDLDNIVLRAMHKEPQRRYSSAAALADDIQNYLEQRPVQARPDAWTYRAGKFLRRNSLAVGLSTVAALIAVILIAFYTYRLAHERDRVALEAAKSRQVAEFLTKIFRVADPAQAQGREITALELLDRGAQDINTQLVDQPLVRADLLHAIGLSYKSLAAYGRAEQLLEESLSIKSAAGVAETVEYARALHELGELRRLQGRFAESEQRLKESLVLQDRLIQGSHDDKVTTLASLGDLYREMRRTKDAYEVLQRAVDMAAAQPGHDQVANAHAMNNLGLVLQELERYQEAESYFREAIRIRSQILGERHPDSLVSRHNLALLMNVTARYGEAAAILQELLPLRRAVQGPDHQGVANVSLTLATVLASLGRYEEAEAAAMESLRIMLRTFGPSHWRTGQSVRRLGIIDLAVGRYVRAEERLRSAATVEAATYGDNDAMPHRTRTLMAVAILGQGRIAEAETLLETSYERLRARSGEHSMDITRTLEALGELRIRQNRLDQATTLLEQAIKNHERIGGARNSETADAQLALAEIALRRGQPAVARELCERSLANLSGELPAEHWRVAFAQATLGRSLMQTGEADRGAALIRKGSQRLLEVLPRDDPRIAPVLTAAKAPSNTSE
jgi:serine/threonine-protein kinase